MKLLLFYLLSMVVIARKMYSRRARGTQEFDFGRSLTTGKKGSISLNDDNKTTLTAGGKKGQINSDDTNEGTLTAGKKGLMKLDDSDEGILTVGKKGSLSVFEVDDNECLICTKENKNRIDSITFRYDPNNAQTSKYQGDKATCRGASSRFSYPSSTTLRVGRQTYSLEEGETFTVQSFQGANINFQFPNFSCSIRTSCSVPLVTNDQIGPFRIISSQGESNCDKKTEATSTYSRDDSNEDDKNHSAGDDNNDDDDGNGDDDDDDEDDNGSRRAKGAKGISRPTPSPVPARTLAPFDSGDGGEDGNDDDDRDDDNIGGGRAKGAKGAKGVSRPTPAPVSAPTPTLFDSVDDDKYGGGDDDDDDDDDDNGDNDDVGSGRAKGAKGYYSRPIPAPVPAPTPAPFDPVPIPTSRPINNNGNNSGIGFDFSVLNPASRPTPRPSLNPTSRPSPNPSRDPTPNPTPQPTFGCTIETMIGDLCNRGQSCNCSVTLGQCNLVCSNNGIYICDPNNNESSSICQANIEDFPTANPSDDNKCEVTYNENFTIETNPSLEWLDSPRECVVEGFGRFMGLFGQKSPFPCRTFDFTPYNYGPVDFSYEIYETSKLDVSLAPEGPDIIGLKVRGKNGVFVNLNLGVLESNQASQSTREGFDWIRTPSPEFDGGKQKHRISVRIPQIFLETNGKIDICFTWNFVGREDDFIGFDNIGAKVCQGNSDVLPPCPRSSPCCPETQPNDGTECSTVNLICGYNECENQVGQFINLCRCVDGMYICTLPSNVCST